MGVHVMLSKKFLCLLILITSSSSSWGMLTVLRAKQTARIDEKPTNGPLVHKAAFSPILPQLRKDLRPTDMPCVYAEQPLFNSYAHKCKEIEEIAEQSQDNQKVYASYYCQTPEGQQKFLHAIGRVQNGEATSLQVVKEIEKAKEIGAYAKRREDSLITDEDSQKKNNALERFKRMILPSPLLPALHKKTESAYLSTSVQQAVLKKMYAHFDGTGNTEITLSTPEWCVVQSLPKETKRNFRSLDEFYTAHRMPTENEQLFYVIGSAGQGACIGAGVIMPYALMKRFGSGAQAAVPSQEELRKQAEGQLIKSFESITENALREVETEKGLSFMDPADEALNKILQTGHKMLIQAPDNLREDMNAFLINTGKELTVSALNLGAQNLGISVLTDPSVVAAALVGGSIGAVRGLRDMNKPCEMQNISKI